VLFITKHKRSIGFMVLIALLALVPVFERSPYYLGLFIMAIVYAILAITFVLMLRTGMVSLGIAAFWGIGAYASATLVTKFHMSFWLSLPVSTLLAALIALIIGYFIIRNAGFSFVIITAVIGMLLPVTIGNLRYFGGYSGFSGIPRPDPIHLPFFPAIEFVSKVQYYYFILLIFVVVILIILAFYAAWTGRAWMAIGYDPILAESVGINLFKYRMAAFILSSSIAALVGVFYAHYTKFLLPDTFGMFTTINAQVYSILGGIGFAVMGPLLGSIIMTFFTEFMRFTGEISPMFSGIILVFLIAFLPTGILSLLDKGAFVDSTMTNMRKNLESLFSKKDKRPKTYPKEGLWRPLKKI
jgi:branched-chain amino acid transport system permease protein